MEKRNDPEKLAKQVGNTLRKLRSERGLSLQELAEISEVSKITLGNIERGEANPSLSIIWKIANGLMIPISALLHENEEVMISRKHQGNKIVSANGACTLEPIFDTTNYRAMEIHRAYLQPNSEYAPGAHQAGVVEYVTVMKGQLTMKIEEDYYQLSEYDSLKFNGDRPHAYINPTDGETVIHFVMTYPKLQ